jgi:hypothetical protein
MWTGGKLPTGAFQLPGALKQRFRVSPHRPELRSGKQRLLTVPALRSDNHFLRTQVEKVLTDRAATTVGLFINRRVNIHKN